MKNELDNSYYYLLCATSVIFFVLVLVAMLAPTPSATAAWGMTLCWPIIPIFGYMDIRHIRSINTFPNISRLWIIGLIIPLVNISVVISYSLHRQWLKSSFDAGNIWGLLISISVFTTNFVIFGGPYIFDLSGHNPIASLALILAISLITLPGLATYYDIKRSLPPCDRRTKIFWSAGMVAPLLNFPAAAIYFTIWRP